MEWRKFDNALREQWRWRGSAVYAVAAAVDVIVAVAAHAYTSTIRDMPAVGTWSQEMRRSHVVVSVVIANATFLRGIELPRHGPLPGARLTLSTKYARETLASAHMARRCGEVAIAGDSTGRSRALDLVDGET